jgi:hypothetical protein
MYKLLCTCSCCHCAHLTLYTPAFTTTSNRDKWYSWPITQAGIRPILLAAPKLSISSMLCNGSAKQKCVLTIFRSSLPESLRPRSYSDKKIWDVNEEIYWLQTGRPEFHICSQVISKKCSWVDFKLVNRSEDKLGTPPFTILFRKSFTSDLRFSRRRGWRWWCSGFWCRVDS